MISPGRFKLSTLSAAVIAICGSSSAQAINWSCGSDNWSNSACWQGGNLPSISDSVEITLANATVKIDAAMDKLGYAQAGSLTIDSIDPGQAAAMILSANRFNVAGDEIIGFSNTATVAQSGGTHQIKQSMVLGYYDSSTGYYSLSGSGILNAGREYIGFAGNGNFTQNGGNNQTGALYLGTLELTSGKYSLAGGSLIADGETIGLWGSGIFNQIGGVHQVSDLTIGQIYYKSGINGSYSLSGGLLQAVHENIGNSGWGTFSQTAGSHRVSSDLSLGYAADGRGSYTLSGGNLDSYLTYVGHGGNGTMTQSGGQHNTTFLHIGYNARATGLYELSGGNLVSGFTYIGHGGTGRFSQSGGTHQASDVQLGYQAGSHGSYALSGNAKLSAVDETLGNDGFGEFTQKGGDNTISNSLYMGLGATGEGSYVLNDGNLSSAAEYIGYAGTGKFTQNDGTNTVNGLLTLAANEGSTGTYNLNGGTLNTAGIVSGKGNGVFSWSGGTLNYTRDLDLTPGASVFGNHLVVGNNQNLVAPNIRVAAGGSITQGAGSSVTVANTLNLLGNYSLNGGSLQLNGTQVIGSGKLINYSSGTIKGYGKIGADFDNGGMLAVIGGNTTISGAFSNSGSIDVVSTKLTVETGLGDNRGIIRLDGGSFDNGGHAITNSGSIFGFGSLSSSDLTNNGNMVFSKQASTIFGDVVNTAQGKIAIDSNAALTVMDDLINNGNIHTATGAYSVYLGSVSGNGSFSGDGNLYFEGGLRPGNSPGLMSASGNVILGETNTTWMELGGLKRGTEYDAFDVLPGSLTLGGGLNIDWYNGFTASAGDSFDLFMADSISGVFASTLFPTLKGINWQVALIQDAYGSTDVFRLTAAAPVPLPAGVWLFASGLPFLLSVRRRGQSVG